MAVGLAKTPFSSSMTGLSGATKSGWLVAPNKSSDCVDEGSVEDIVEDSARLVVPLEPLKCVIESLDASSVEVSDPVTIGVVQRAGSSDFSACEIAEWKVGS